MRKSGLPKRAALFCMNNMTLFEILLNYNYSIDFNKMKVYTKYSEKERAGSGHRNHS